MLIDEDTRHEYEAYIDKTVSDLDLGDLNEKQQENLKKIWRFESYLKTYSWTCTNVSYHQARRNPDHIQVHGTQCPICSKRAIPDMVYDHWRFTARLKLDIRTPDEKMSAFKAALKKDEKKENLKKKILIEPEPIQHDDLEFSELHDLADQYNIYIEFLKNGQWHGQEPISNWQLPGHGTSRKSCGQGIYFRGCYGQETPLTREQEIQTEVHQVSKTCAVKPTVMSCGQIQCLECLERTIATIATRAKDRLLAFSFLSDSRIYKKKY